MFREVQGKKLAPFEEMHQFDLSVIIVLLRNRCKEIDPVASGCIRVVCCCYC